jgi:hypothetical protein
MAAVVSSSMPNGSSSSMGQYYASKVGELSEVRVILLKLNDSKNEIRNEIYVLSIINVVAPSTLFSGYKLLTICTYIDCPRTPC